MLRKTMQTFGDPGLSLAIVEDGQIAKAEGYGVRKMGTDLKADEHTAFPIGSESKAFTSAALAILVDRKKLKWSDLVKDKLPGFQMYDPYVTDHMTVRDLLTHRSGLSLGEGDLLMVPDTNSDACRLRACAAISEAGNGFPREICVRQYPLHRRGLAGAGRVRADLGRLRSRRISSSPRAWTMLMRTTTSTAPNAVALHARINGPFRGMGDQIDPGQGA